MPSVPPRPSLLVSAAWLADNHGRLGLRVVDARWRVDGSGRRHHAEGHVPGAVYIDWATDLVDPDDPLPYQLARPEAFAGAMVRAGISNETAVIVLDDTYSLYASRVWWSLSAYGVKGVRLLDGGWPAWLELGGPVSTAASEVPSVAFSPSAEPDGRVNGDEVLRRLGDGRTQLLDARTPAEYLGQGGPGPRRGHIAGALNVPAALLTREGTQLFPSEEQLGRTLAGAGVSSDRPAIAYDEIGVGAAKLAFCLELIGLQEVALYDGGWRDWAARDPESYPVEA